MPQRVQGPDGNTYEFPDGTTKDKAIAYFKKRGIAGKPLSIAGTAHVPGLQERADAKLTEFSRPRTAEEINKQTANAPIHAPEWSKQVERTTQNVGRRAIGGLASMLLHPIQTAEGTYQTGKELVTVPLPTFNREIDDKNIKDYESANQNSPIHQRVAEFQKDYAENPRTAIENLSGDLLGMYLSGKLLDAGGKVIKPFVKGVAGVIPKIARAGAEIATDTTPRETAQMVRGASEGNAAEAAKAAEKNTAQEAKRGIDLKKHFEKTQATKAANEAATSPIARKEALGRGVEHLDTKFKADLDTLKKSVNEKANAKYSALNAALDEVPANRDFLPTALEESSSQIKGSNTEPAIFKDMEKRFNGTEPLTYRDLQGYYSELGKELSKGTLPGDVYHAYDLLQESIGQEMQRVADSRGMGPQLADARATWRQMKQTFYDPKSPLTKALKSTERGKAISALQGADQSGIEALAKYDPELAKRANTIRGYQAEAKSIPAKPGALKSLPKLGPKEAPVVPKQTTLTPESIQAAKEQSLLKGTDTMRHSKSPLVSAVAGYGTIKALLMRNLPTAGLDIAARLLYGAAKPALATMLENPKIVAELTKFNARDAAAIQRLPPEARTAFVGDFKPVVDAAKAKGVPVSPALSALVGSQAATQKKGVAAALQPVGEQ